MCPYVMFFYLLDLFSYQVSLVVTACSDSLVRVFNTLTQSLVEGVEHIHTIVQNVATHKDTVYSLDQV